MQMVTHGPALALPLRGRGTWGDSHETLCPGSLLKPGPAPHVSTPPVAESCPQTEPSAVPLRLARRGRRTAFLDSTSGREGRTGAETGNSVL